MLHKGTITLNYVESLSLNLRFKIVAELVRGVRIGTHLLSQNFLLITSLEDSCYVDLPAEAMRERETRAQVPRRWGKVVLSKHCYHSSKLETIRKSTSGRVDAS